jgi:uncharacterized protein YkwD
MMSRPVAIHAGPPRALVVLLFLGTLIAGQFATAPAASALVWKPVVDRSVDPMADLVEYEDRVLVAVNRQRKRAGLKPVRLFETCPDLLAEAWATKLALLGDLVHRDQQVLLDRCGYSWAGETLVSGAGLKPRAAVRAWMDSPPHRAVLLTERADRAGIGTVLGLDGQLYSVLNFGDAP